MAEKPPEDNDYNFTDLVNNIDEQEKLHVAKSAMLEALRYGMASYAGTTKLQFFPDTDIREWNEYKDAVMDGLNRVGEKIREDVEYISVETLTNMWNFYRDYGKGHVDLNKCTGYKRVLAGTIVGILHSIKSADLATCEVKKIYETFGEEINIESLKEVHSGITPTEITLLKFVINHER